MRINVYSQELTFIRGLNDLVRKTGCVIESDGRLWVQKHSTGRHLYDVELSGLYKRRRKEASK